MNVSSPALLVATTLLGACGALAQTDDAADEPIAPDRPVLPTGARPSRRDA